MFIKNLSPILDSNYFWFEKTTSVLNTLEREQLIVSVTKCRLLMGGLTIIRGFDNGLHNRSYQKWLPVISHIA